MKTTFLALFAFAALGVSSLSGLSRGIQANDEHPAINPPSLTSPIAALQEPAPVNLAATQEPAPSSEASPSDMPVEPATVVEWDSVPVVLPEAPFMYPEGATCATCCQQVCCCEVATTLCLVDPCDGCSYEACVHLPHCCVGSAPVVTWKNGLLGRKVISLCWPCCDKRAKVVVPVIGDVRVWE